MRSANPTAPCATAEGCAPLATAPISPAHQRLTAGAPPIANPRRRTVLPTPRRQKLDLSTTPPLREHDAGIDIAPPALAPVKRAARIKSVFTRAAVVGFRLFPER